MTIEWYRAYYKMKKKINMKNFQKIKLMNLQS